MDGTKQKYEDKDYLSLDPFADDCDREMAKMSLVITKKRQLCAFCKKRKRVGTKMFCEAAKVEGEFQRHYACLPCLEHECDMRDWATRLPRAEGAAK